MQFIPTSLYQHDRVLYFARSAVQRNRIRVLPLSQTKSCLFYLSRWPLKVLPTPAKQIKGQSLFRRSRQGHQRNGTNSRSRIGRLIPANAKLAAFVNADDEDEGELVSDDHDIKCPETELHLYLECGKTKDVLRFCENNKLVFPRLFAITRKIFCVPGTTAGVERLFSIAGFVLSNRRLSLTDANFHNHVFAHCNFGLAASGQSKRKFDDK